MQKTCITHLGKFAIPREVEAGKVHVRESRVHVKVHIRSGGGSAAVQVVLPGGERDQFSLFEQYFIQVKLTHAVFFNSDVLRLYILELPSVTTANYCYCAISSSTKGATGELKNISS